MFGWCLLGLHPAGYLQSSPKEVALYALIDDWQVPYMAVTGG